MPRLRDFRLVQSILASFTIVGYDENDNNPATRGIRIPASLFKGDKGDTGNTGAKGDTGATGAASTVPGPKGDTGNTGPKGDKGDTGEAGADGISNVPGPAGPAGPKGDKGDDGISVKGDKGDKGDTGNTGAAGTNGTNGTNGQGVPVGGTTGQVLAKSSNSDYATSWVNQSGGGGGSGLESLSLSGTTNAYLIRNDFFPVKVTNHAPNDIIGDVYLVASATGWANYFGHARGVIAFNSGNNAAAYSYATTFKPFNMNTLSSGNYYEFRCRCFMYAAVSSNNYAARVGVVDPSLTLMTVYNFTTARGIWFEALALGGAPGNWNVGSATGGTATYINTGIPASSDINNQQVLKIVAQSTTIKAYIDDVEVASFTTATYVGTNLAPCFGGVKGAGTFDSTFLAVDYAELKSVWSTPRK